MKSIVQGQADEKKCFICGRTDLGACFEEHHIFGGANRRNSEEYGLKVTLCHNCHNEPPRGVHHNDVTMNYLHKVGQKAFESKCGSRADFMKIFGRNYLK
jgi:hypothetical protein